jgi:uncharacterized protein YjbJ (UPF0337 family)
MGAPNRDEMEGKWDQTKGKVKEGLGRAFDNEEMEQEGRVDQVKGNVQEGFGTTKRKIGETVEDLGEDIKR